MRGGARHLKKNARIIREQSLITCTSLNTTSPSLLSLGSHTEDPFCQEMERGQGARRQTAGEKEDVLEETWKNPPPPSLTHPTPSPPPPLVVGARARTYRTHLPFPPISHFPTQNNPTIGGGGGGGGEKKNFSSSFERRNSV